jgi:hypothetical protein
MPMLADETWLRRGCVVIVMSKVFGWLHSALMHTQRYGTVPMCSVHAWTRPRLVGVEFQAHFVLWSPPQPPQTSCTLCLFVLQGRLFQPGPLSGWSWTTPGIRARDLNERDLGRRGEGSAASALQMWPGVGRL